uniref:Immunoglobulin-like beta-sandwich domain-containing protein n=1 Tax=Gorilla gorilla gorilla TaxID=9595 RepID=G3RY01_GORGO
FFLLQGAWPHMGVHRKPSLLALPGPLVKSEETIILQCRSDVMFEHFLLHREGEFNDTLRPIGELHDGVSEANFSIGPMTPVLAGTYRCYSSVPHSSYELSSPSDPLDIVITGLYEKPSLSAQPGPTVLAGENPMTCTIYPGRGRPMNVGSLQGPRSTEHSRLTFLWALPPTEGPTDASALSMYLPTSGQTRVTHCLFLSQETLQVVHLHPLNQAPKLVSKDPSYLCFWKPGDVGTLDSSIGSAPPSSVIVGLSSNISDPQTLQQRRVSEDSKELSEVSSFQISAAETSSKLDGRVQI